MFKNNLNIIAEIGINHEGSFQKAQELLKSAAETGVDFVKFQSYTPKYYASAINPERLERVSKFSLTEENFKTLSKQAGALGIGFLSTPLTEDWVNKLSPLCAAFKIASGDITFKPVIQQAAKTGKTIILSTGAATLDEVDQAVNWVSDIVGKEKLKDRLILMQCVSAYPTPIEQANILSIPFLKERYGVHIGYSNHVIGMNACLGAAALGAKVIEVHFTDCKEGRSFRDHSLSFDEADLKEFVSRAHDIRKSLGTYTKEVQPCEEDGRPLMRKGLIAANNLKAGETLTPDNVIFARPATEFTSNEFDSLLGKTLQEDVKEGFLIPRSAI